MMTLRWRLVLCSAAMASALAGQMQPQMPAGVEAPWDVKKILAALNTDNQQLKPLLAQMNPQQWYDQKGASSTYIVQWQAAKAQVDDVIAASAGLAQKTEDLSLCLDAYFRLEVLDTLARSVLEGAMKYGDRTAAGKMSELIAHNFNNRERFRDYIRELATNQQANFKIADAEAQRCRGMISQQTPVRSKKTK